MTQNKLQNILTVVLIIAVISVGYFFLQPRVTTFDFGGGILLSPFSSGVTNSDVTVNTTTTELLAANSARSYAQFCNNALASATNTVFLSFGAGATTTQGVSLEVGECFVVDKDFPFTGVVNAISLTANISVGVVEK